MSVDVVPVHYRPHDGTYRFDVEVIDAAELRGRVASEPTRGFERVDFHSFLYVRSGAYVHTVDFRTYECSSGSCLSIAPGQVHRFGPPSRWDGWLVVVGAHHVLPSVHGLPTHVRLPDRQAAAIVELLERMVVDATSPGVEALLALEAQVLVRRLALVAGGDAADEPHADPVAVERYREYREAVDREFRRWHLVAPYARWLACSSRTLNRACRAVGGTTAKQVIVERIVLEAKRLLAHERRSVSSVSAELGFDEPTNFVKFFRRETGRTPAAFGADPW